MGEWMYSSTYIHDLSTRWRWLVSFASRPLYHRGKSQWYPMDRRLGGLQSRCRHSGSEERKIHAPTVNLTPVVQTVAQPLYCLSYPGSWWKLVKSVSGSSGITDCWSLFQRTVPPLHIVSVSATTFQDSILCNASAAPTSEVRPAAMLALLMAGN